ncbi:G-protein coupled receptor family C group 5 member B-like [Pristis pectinata]|uniref:G-protein coupled receptor family C group 5 member B-like n=1 Tax=Pristis pectinata TaxID=685728 RepID=UPI00223E74F1|nr:G-protein coupled receptor family C group 5 member B-like [Pristis pectinata]XP_051899198.1 G-protein coupled receptor family C group 5 member B-like [Pristis pectinata]
MNWKIIAALPFLLTVFNDGSAQVTPPRGCGSDLLSVYFNLCDLDAVWGIVLETIAALGIVISLVLIVVLLGITPFIADSRKKASIPILCIFLLGTMGIFGLTFAFIIKFDQRTCPTRIFLWGVLFAICFSCLLVQVWRVLKLVRSGNGPSGCCMVAMVLCLTLVQVIIAIEYLVLVTFRFSKACVYNSTDFTMLLIYVMFLMALTFVLSMFTFCGHYQKWKKYGAYIFVTMLLSIAIWVVWIVMLVRGNVSLNRSPQWDDPTLSIALVANGWVFLLFYIIPQLRHITCPAKPEDEPLDEAPQDPHSGMMSGIDNQVFMYEEQGRGFTMKHSSVASSPPYSNSIPMENNMYSAPPEFTIPRPQTKSNYYPAPFLQDPYLNYQNRQTTF